MAELFPLKTRVAVLSLIAVFGGSTLLPAERALAQTPAQGASGGDKAQSRVPKDLIGLRVKRQLKRIQSGLDSGKLTAEQADKLRLLVNKVSSDAKAMRDQNGGALKDEQLVQVKSNLDQTFNQIETALGAGTKLPEDGSALGPKWKAGEDGAQDPKALLKQMKAQEKRALRQERQNNMQMLEQQQLDYEKEVVNKLGQQRPAIQEKKQELQNVREQAGAN